MRQSASRQIVFIKLSIIAAVVLAIFGFYGFSVNFKKVRAFSSGPSASYTNAPGEANCAACHTGNSINDSSGNLLISGLPANYLPNQQIPVTVTVNRADAVIFGFQLTAIDNQGKKVGTFTLAPQTPQQLQTKNGNVGGNQRQYVEHTSSGIIPTQFGTKSWTFTWDTPPQRVGKVSFYASGNAANSDGGTAGDFIYTTSKNTLSGTAISNFDADDKSDLAVFRPSNGTWYSLNSTNGDVQSIQFGANGDEAVAGDYDADGKTDIAVFRPSNGTWYVQKSSGGFQSAQFGAESDVPVVGDYDGDLKSDFAVFRPSNGVWYILRSSDGKFVSQAFGFGTDKTAQGDYDADGKTDIAVFRPSEGTWYLMKSTEGFSAVKFGSAEDKPVPADFDGDGKTDVAVYRPSNGTWYVSKSREGFSGVAFGAAGDKPVPADFDGDGKADIAVYRPSEGAWFLLRSSNNSFYAAAFGAAEDIPVPSGYVSQ
ncbi:MAG: choice-of-anchor V domain-containing protein [Pyrinomonadaceae bacterium]